MMPFIPPSLGAHSAAGGSLTTPFGPTPVEHRRSPGINLRLFVFILLALVGGAIVRSAIATRLDGFTIDEAYHIAVGVSYVRNADFRINPEHPPLVKLWVGSLISVTGFRLSSIRPFTDKEDERNFTEETSTSITISIPCSDAHGLRCGR
jgi:hypothetical protein